MSDQTSVASDLPLTARFRGLDHVALLVTDTEEALRVYRDRMGLPVLFSEVVNNGTIRLTHLDMGNVHLQLVQPLNESHPLYTQLMERGPGLHHLCFAVDDIGAAMTAATEQGLELAQAAPHQAPNGKRAAFLAKGSTGDVQFEMTGE